MLTVIAQPDDDDEIVLKFAQFKMNRIYLKMKLLQCHHSPDEAALETGMT